MPIPFTDFIDILGTFSFAVAGAFAAMEKKLDLFGVLVMAFVTAIGGGTIRDLLIGETPVGWLRNPAAGWVIGAGAVGALIFGSRLKRINSLLTIFDALGLGLFTMIGIRKGVQHLLSPGVCIALGTITGSFGGVIRDVFLNKVPLLFQKEIYASACILGGGIYFLLMTLQVAPELAEGICILLIFAIRMLAVRLNWHLPVWYKAAKD